MAKASNPCFKRKTVATYSVKGEWTNNGIIVTDDGREIDLLCDLKEFNNCYVTINVKQTEEDE
jgi:hypothetical protein